MHANEVYNRDHPQMAIGAQTTPRPLEDFLKNNSSCSLKASFRDQKSYSVSEIEMNSNSHLDAYSYPNKGKEQLKTSRLEPVGNQALSQTLMAIYRNLFNSLPCQTPVSQSLQSSQNPAKDPRGNPERSTSRLCRRRPCNVYLSSRVGEVVMDINPTCGVEAELGIQTVIETALD